MRWWFSFGWLHIALEKRRRHRPTRRWVRYIRPHLEPLEKRQLLDNNVWLPQQLYAFDGTTQTLLETSLFRPATTTLLPQLELQGASISAAGSVSLTDSGVFSLSLSQTGPYDNNGDSYSFSESGTISFALSESGTFSATGFSITSVTLTETAALSWSFVETNSGGQTVQNLRGSNTTVSVSNGAAPFDPFFPQGFNWLTPTLKISSLNSLSLSNLTASSLTINETNGSENYTFQLTNGVATVTGNVRQPLSDSLLQTGQNSYTETAVESFNSSNSGRDSFSLSELGSYGNNSYSLSSVSYSEQSGTQSTQFNATVADSQSGTATESGMQSFSGNNHSLGDSSSESFQFNNLSTLSYGESATSNFSMTQQGSYGGGSFSLGSLTYNANGSGGYSGQETASDSSSGNDSFNLSGSGSFSNDSFSLATYMLQGGSAATSSSSDSEQENDNGAASCFNDGQQEQQSVSLYQTWTQNSNGYSNVSYNYQEVDSSTLTAADQGPGYSSSDTWVTLNSTSLYNNSNDNTASAAVTYQCVDASGGQTVSNSSSTTPASNDGTPAVQFTAPDANLVPAAGADRQSSSGSNSGSSSAINNGTGLQMAAGTNAPVGVNISLQQISANDAWMGNTVQAAVQAVTPVVQTTTGSVTTTDSLSGGLTAAYLTLLNQAIEDVQEGQVQAPVVRIVTAAASAAAASAAATAEPSSISRAASTSTFAPSPSTRSPPAAAVAAAAAGTPPEAASTIWSTAIPSPPVPPSAPTSSSLTASWPTPKAASI